MRVLQIRFKNLNSLAGEWIIDLNHPAYLSSGIFAITGPTGAGKTSILDALCLALYGRTPRLNRVSKGGNEVMSRQTGECFAEVTFETQAGRYRCHWSQHRSRKKASGELQAPKHEISDARTGAVCQSSIRGVAEQIEAVTGMDFDRFTRSMLLAQGGFDAFLKAAPDERAPILEQITGTEIYSRISMAVHERRGEEKRRLEALQSELNGLQALSEGELASLTTRLDALRTAETELSSRMDGLRQAQAWRDGIQRLEGDLKALQGEQEALGAQRSAFEPQRSLLERAERALDPAADYAALQALREAQTRDIEAQELCRVRCGIKEAELKQASLALQEVSAAQAQALHAQREASGLLRQVREMDSRLAEKQAPIAKASEALAEARKGLQTLSQALKVDQETLERKRMDLDAVGAELQRRVADEALVEQLEAVRTRFLHLHELRGGLEDHGKKLDLAAAEAQRLETQRQGCAQALEGAKADLARAEEALRQARGRQEQLLGQSSAADRRAGLETLRQRVLRLEALEGLGSELRTSQTLLSEMEDRGSVLDRERLELEGEEKEQILRVEGAEKEVSLLQTQLELLNAIRDLDQARIRLQDGEPCPLCGALDHPFARGNLPLPDETRLRLDGARAVLKGAGQELSRLQIALAGHRKELEQLHRRRLETDEARRTIQGRMDEGLAALGLEATEGRLEGLIAEDLREGRLRLSSAEQLVCSLDAVAQEMESLRADQERCSAEVTKHQNRLFAASTQAHLAEQDLCRHREHGQLLEHKLQKALSEARDQLAPFGVVEVEPKNLRAIYENLRERRQAWVQLREQRTALEKDVLALEARIRNRTEQKERDTLSLGAAQSALAALTAERDTLLARREALYGAGNPDEEEARLAAALEQANQSLDAARAAQAGVREELLVLQSRVSSLGEAMEERRLRLQAAEEAFLARLARCGFASEGDFLQACLPEEQRRDLQQQARDLAEAQASLDARRSRLQDEFQAQKDRRLSDLAPEGIAEQLRQASEELKDIHGQAGAIAQQLRNNEDLLMRQADKLAEVEAQRLEMRRWDGLHELIGSSDGKKFRNFAQGLTFEMMIGHANRQLRLMSDRYLLVRETASPLELCVLDSYQAGEIRSTRNLSGGESFIISLALALGLSRMSSRNVRVDSLFLDEGFGTLDEEALETALETLGSLQQEGKLIGVISHVQALKERIGTQIQVIPQTGGRSILAGPGCSGQG